MFPNFIQEPKYTLIKTYEEIDNLSRNQVNFSFSVTGKDGCIFNILIGEVDKSIYGIILESELENKKLKIKGKKETLDYVKEYLRRNGFKEQIVNILLSTDDFKDVDFGSFDDFESDVFYRLKVGDIIKAKYKTKIRVGWREEDVEEEGELIVLEIGVGKYSLIKNSLEGRFLANYFLQGVNVEKKIIFYTRDVEKDGFEYLEIIGEFKTSSRKCLGISPKQIQVKFDEIYKSFGIKDHISCSSYISYSEEEVLKLQTILDIFGHSLYRLLDSEKFKKDIRNSTLEIFNTLGLEISDLLLVKDTDDFKRYLQNTEFMNVFLEDFLKLGIYTRDEVYTSLFSFIPKRLGEYTAKQVLKTLREQDFFENEKNVRNWKELVFPNFIDEGNYFDTVGAATFESLLKELDFYLSTENILKYIDSLRDLEDQKKVITLCLGSKNRGTVVPKDVETLNLRVSVTKYFLKCLGEVEVEIVKVENGKLTKAYKSELKKNYSGDFFEEYLKNLSLQYTTYKELFNNKDWEERVIEIIVTKESTNVNDCNRYGGFESICPENKQLLDSRDLDRYSIITASDLIEKYEDYTEGEDESLLKVLYIELLEDLRKTGKINPIKIDW